MTYQIIAILIVVILAFVFVVTFILNRRTPKPEGCQDLIDFEACKMCDNSLCKAFNKEKE